MSTPPIAYEVTVAGTVYRCRGVSLTYEAPIMSLDIAQDPNKLILQEVHQIGTQKVTCPEVKLPLMDHMIRPVWRAEK